MLDVYVYYDSFISFFLFFSPELSLCVFANYNINVFAAFKVGLLTSRGVTAQSTVTRGRGVSVLVHPGSQFRLLLLRGPLASPPLRFASDAFSDASGCGCCPAPLPERQLDPQEREEGVTELGVPEAVDEEVD